MKIRFTPMLVLSAALLAGVAHASSIDQFRNIKLDRAVSVGGTVVPAGTFRLEFSSGGEKARFVQGKRTIAEVPCKVGLTEAVYRGTAMHYRPGADGRDQLVKIVLGDEKLAIVFPEDSADDAQASVSAPASSRP